MHFFQPLKAAIWDLDGVIVDSLPTHCKALQVILKRYGYHHTYEQLIPLFGMTDVTVLRTISGDRFTETEIRSLADEKERIYQDMIITEAKPFEGVIDWLDAFRAADMKQALASSSVTKSIEMILKSMHLRSYFDAVVSGEGGPSKPNPAVFLRAAEQVGVLPHECLVLEDAVVGVKAAKAAGMYCVGVTTTNTAENLQQADLIVTRLNQLTVPGLQSIITD